MIIKLTNLKELPYKLYTGHLLKSEDDAKQYEDGYLYISKSPKMIILYTEFIEEIHGKVSKNN